MKLSSSWYIMLCPCSPRWRLFLAFLKVTVKSLSDVFHSQWNYMSTYWVWYVIRSSMYWKYLWKSFTHKVVCHIVRKIFLSLVVSMAAAKKNIIIYFWCKMHGYCLCPSKHICRMDIHKVIKPESIHTMLEAILSQTSFYWSNAVKQNHLFLKWSWVEQREYH